VALRRGVLIIAPSAKSFSHPSLRDWEEQAPGKQASIHVRGQLKTWPSITLLCGFGTLSRVRLRPEPSGRSAVVMVEPAQDWHGYDRAIAGLGWQSQGNRIRNLRLASLDEEVFC
jgi:hypothetical protein